jgi:transcriptional regulator with XRE-family HTH domain
MISRELVTAIKLASKKHYQIAQEAGIHPSTLSKILNGIETVKQGDPRILKIGKVLGLAEDKLFD